MGRRNQLAQRGLSHARIAHQSGNPRMRRIPVSYIVGQNVERHFGSYVFESFIWKCAYPIHDFIVPNGCSTV